MVPKQELDELDVEVIEVDPQVPRYRVQIKREDLGEFTGAMELDDYRQPIFTGSPLAITSFGLSLFSRLFGGALANAFNQALAGAQARKRRLRIRLSLSGQNPLLHSIPWELMYFDDSGGRFPARPLATDDAFAFSRYLDSPRPQGEPVGHRPLRLLVAMAAPNDLKENWPGLAPIDRESELRDLSTRFSAMVASGQVAPDFLVPVSAERLEAALAGGSIEQDTVRPDGYDVLLFYGHGLFSSETGTVLMLEDEITGEGTLYAGDLLISRLQQLDPDKLPSLIILVSCNTANEAERKPAGRGKRKPAASSATELASNPYVGSLAARIVADAGVPAVLAMRHLVEIPLARTFTFHLSDYLLREGVIDVAVGAARRRVFQADNPNWSTPVLYMRARDGRLFVPNARVEYIQSILLDPNFIRWRGREFINLEVVTVPARRSWQLLAERPDHAPPATDALQTIERALQLEALHLKDNLIVLTGPPHSGQTTMMQRLASDLARAASDEPTANRPLGIYVPMGGYEQQRQSGNRLERVIVAAAAARVPQLGEELSQLFGQTAGPRAPAPGAPRYVFLLDDLNAVPADLRRAATVELLKLAFRHPEHRFLVSCIQDFMPAEMAQYARVLLLQPLNERQILRYVKQRAPERGPAIFRQIAENRLLDLATDPSLLVRIYERMAQEGRSTVSRTQLLQEVLSDKIGSLLPRYVNGAAAYETLLELAWELRWSHRTALPLREAFAIMARVRRERDYNLEDLYQALSEERLLVDAGQQSVRFVQPALLTYCTALALMGRPDFLERLTDIVLMCGSSWRMAWWEDVLYAVAGMAADPAPLELLGLHAIPENSSAYTLLLARCLEVLSDDARRRLSQRGLQQILDSCALGLRPEREPLPTRRAQIATALGRLPYPQTITELKRLITRRVRKTPNGDRYDYTNVRIAAARGLRALLARAWNADDQPALPSAADRPGAANQMTTLSAAAAINDLDPTMVELLRLWASDDSDQAHALLRQTLQSTSNQAPERSVAAFALGDLAACDEDIDLLLDTIVRPVPAQIGEDDWHDTIWACTDALTLFDAEKVALKLARVLAAHRQSLSAISVEQLAYLAGRVRAQDTEVVTWLMELLIRTPNPTIKGKALQSLAWLGHRLEQIEIPQLLGPPAFHVRQLTTIIAAWRSDLATYQTPLGPFTIDVLDRDAPDALYLRRKALEALTWIGTQQDVEDLFSSIIYWPLELREAWYLTDAAVRARAPIPDGGIRS